MWLSLCLATFKITKDLRQRSDQTLDTADGLDETLEIIWYIIDSYKVVIDSLYEGTTSKASHINDVTCF